MRMLENSLWLLHENTLRGQSRRGSRDQVRSDCSKDDSSSSEGHELCWVLGGF